MTRYNLAQTARFDMSHLDETLVEDENVRWMPCDVLCRALPLDGALGATGVAMAVHIQPELCEEPSAGRW